MAQIKEHAADSPVVVVQGLGFVGAAAAAVIADASDADGRPRWFVIGVDLPSPQCWWKIAKINEGKTPIQTPDPEFDRLVHRAVLERRNLCATCLEEAYAMAGVIVVDVQLDVTARLAQSLSDIRLDLQGFEAAIRVVGRRMRPDTLVLIETTVPVGACGQIVLPILQAERAKRGIETPVRLAHAYERVMPGPNYVNSIRRFWRTYSGIDRESAVLARNFLSTFIDTANYPLYELERPYDSELAKLLENSYRALNIGFIHEWTLLAEKIGVNLFEVIESIRVRKGTHDNIRYPGFGVGGYCLTKDSLLAQWSALNLFDTDVTLSMTLEALRVNHEMPRHTFDLLQEIVGNKLSGLRVLVCGISYLPELADTRNSPTELLYADLIQAGAVVVLHDPQVARWLERPEAVVASDMRKALAEAEAVVFAVPHRAYRELSVPQLLAAAPRLRAVVDAQNILTDSAAAALHQAGRRVAGVGKGHWRRSGYHLARS
jgi:nucleotide sugar dehydrogenase